MIKPFIICVAITRSMPRKSHNPAVPVTIVEQVENPHAAFEAGAVIAHCHVPNDDESPQFRSRKVYASAGRLAAHCLGMIVQFSTRGRSGTERDRGGMLGLRPDMASLTVGSHTFPSHLYENPPDLVDWLDSEI